MMSLVLKHLPCQCLRKSLHSSNMLARQQDGDRPLEETVADTQTFEGSWNLIFRASGIIGIAFLFYQRWVQVQSGLLAYDLSTDIAALKTYPNHQLWQAPY